MQTLAEKRLKEFLVEHCLRSESNNIRILNIGAGKSTVVERFVAAAGINFTCDRLDIEDCTVDADFVGTTYIQSVDNMSEIPESTYDLAFSNYVLEHVINLVGAAAEIFRVLKPDGYYITSVPNPVAPEYVLARHTGFGFHKFVRAKLGKSEEAWETAYSYKNIRSLLDLFESRGFSIEDLKYSSCVEQYFERFYLLKYMANFYDRFLSAIRKESIMGNAVIVLKKPAKQSL